MPSFSFPLPPLFISPFSPPLLLLLFLRTCSRPIATAPKTWESWSRFGRNQWLPATEFRVGHLPPARLSAPPRRCRETDKGARVPLSFPGRWVAAWKADAGWCRALRVALLPPCMLSSNVPPLGRKWWWETAKLLLWLVPFSVCVRSRPGCPRSYACGPCCGLLALLTPWSRLPGAISQATVLCCLLGVSRAGLSWVKVDSWVAWVTLQAAWCGLL